MYCGVYFPEYAEDFIHPIKMKRSGGGLRTASKEELSTDITEEKKPLDKLSAATVSETEDD